MQLSYHRSSGQEQGQGQGQGPGQGQGQGQGYMNVTREAAHNFVVIYRRSQSYDLALEIMNKYLRI